MKRFISIMALLFTLTFTANAMSYEQAREQALFLTDKMAYELNLTDDQYEAAYEINLDYLMSVNTVDDLYGSYWRYRNLDMSYVLLDWQYRAFCDAAYFYRPLYFSGGYWRFGVYARYPHRDYFYFDRPRVYISYCGGHSWHRNHGRSWYDGRHYGPRPGSSHFGMRDGFDRGDYGKGNRQRFGNRLPDQQRGTTSFGSRVNTQQNKQNSSFGSRGSSTRTTVRQPITNEPQRNSFGTNRGGNSFGSNRGGNNNSPRPTFGPSVQRQQTTSPSTSFGSNRGNSSFGSNRGGNSFGSNRGGNSFGGSRGGSSFGSSRGGGSRVSTPSRGSFNGGGSNNSCSSKSGFGSRR